MLTTSLLQVFVAFVVIVVYAKMYSYTDKFELVEQHCAHNRGLLRYHTYHFMSFAPFDNMGAVPQLPIGFTSVTR